MVLNYLFLSLQTSYNSVRAGFLLFRILINRASAGRSTANKSFSPSVVEKAETQLHFTLNTYIKNVILEFQIESVRHATRSEVVPSLEVLSTVYPPFFYRKNH